MAAASMLTGITLGLVAACVALLGGAGIGWAVLAYLGIGSLGAGLAVLAVLMRDAGTLADRRVTADRRKSKRPVHRPGVAIS